MEGQAEREQDSFIESQSAERSALTSFLMLSSVPLMQGTLELQGCLA